MQTPKDSGTLIVYGLLVIAAVLGVGGVIAAFQRHWLFVEACVPLAVVAFVAFLTLRRVFREHERGMRAHKSAAGSRAIQL